MIIAMKIMIQMTTLLFLYIKGVYIYFVYFIGLSSTAS